jgi:hypothetical protein
MRVNRGKVEARRLIIEWRRIASSRRDGNKLCYPIQQKLYLVNRVGSAARLRPLAPVAPKDAVGCGLRERERGAGWGEVGCGEVDKRFELPDLTPLFVAHCN